MLVAVTIMPIAFNLLARPAEGASPACRPGQFRRDARLHGGSCALRDGRLAPLGSGSGRDRGLRRSRVLRDLRHHPSCRRPWSGCRNRLARIRPDVRLVILGVAACLRSRSGHRYVRTIGGSISIQQVSWRQPPGDRFSIGAGHHRGERLGQPPLRPGGNVAQYDLLLQHLGGRAHGCGRPQRGDLRRDPDHRLLLLPQSDGGDPGDSQSGRRGLHHRAHLPPVRGGNADRGPGRAGQPEEHRLSRLHSGWESDSRTGRSSRNTWETRWRRSWKTGSRPVVWPRS